MINVSMMIAATPVGGSGTDRSGQRLGRLLLVVLAMSLGSRIALPRGRPGY